MKTYLKLLSIFIILLSVNQSSLKSQVVNKFGVKGGVILSRMSLSYYNAEIMTSEPSGKFNFLSVDAGLYVEFFDSRYFCVSTELHYKINGEEENEDFTVLTPDNAGEIESYSYKHISDRFHCLSFQILPRWKYIVNSEDKLYLFAGPRFDFRISNYNARFDNAVEFENSKFQAGFTVGIGNEIWDFLSIEARYEYNFTNTYTIIYGNQEIDRKHSAFLMLAGVSLKKLLRINL